MKKAEEPRERENSGKAIKGQESRKIESNPWKNNDHGKITVMERIAITERIAIRNAWNLKKGIDKECPLSVS